MIVISYYFSRSKEVENFGRFWKYSCQQLFKGTRRFVAYNFKIKVLIAYWFWLQVGQETEDHAEQRSIWGNVMHNFTTSTLECYIIYGYTIAHHRFHTL